MHEHLAIFPLLLQAAAAPQPGGAAAADPLELHATCDRGARESPRACLELGRMYLEGRGVERSLAYAHELAMRGCLGPGGSSEQACFTGFLWGADTGQFLGNGGSYWEPLRELVLARDADTRKRLIASWREPSQFYWFLDPFLDEVKALPDLPELQKIVRARIVEIAHSDPEPVNRSYCAEVYDYVVGFKGLEEMARSDPDPEVRRVAARARLEPELQIAAREGDSATVLKVKDPDARRHGVEMLADQAALANAAQTDPDEGVRAAAVRNLEDQAVLARIAEKGKDEGTRVSAAAAVKDPVVLERWAEESRDADIREIAVQRIGNQAVLARVAERDPEYSIREQAIRRLTDQAALRRIATHKARGLRRGELRKLQASAVRAAAVAKLSDQKLLFELATKDEDEKVCLAAMDALKDQKLLLDVAARRPGEKGARAVAERLTDQEALRSFLESQPDAVARVTAAGHITDPALAVKVARSDRADTVVRMAVSRITDQVLLQQLARSDAPPVARAAAVAQLTDRKVLRELEESSPYPDVRGAAAVQLVRDPAEAARYARTSKDVSIRWLAARVVTDQEVLKELATKDPDMRVRWEAISRMTDKAALAEIARSTTNGVAEARLSKLNRVPTRFELEGRNPQQGVAGTSLKPFVVKVWAGGSPVPAAKVSFRLVAGAGTLSATEVLTDDEGTASTTLTLGSTPGPVRVSAAISGFFPRMFSATTLPK